MTDKKAKTALLPPKNSNSCLFFVETVSAFIPKNVKYGNMDFYGIVGGGGLFSSREINKYKFVTGGKNK